MLEETEVEVLEEDKIEFKVLAELRTLTKEESMFVINGRPIHPKTVEYQALVCPSCGYVLQEFNPGYPATVINEALLDKATQDALYRLHSHCPHCGQRLSFDREIVSVQ